MTYTFKLSDIIPASAQAIYQAWLDSRGHTAMTGSAAKASTAVGGRFTAWGGYISGQNLELAPGKRIVQSWRTTKFTAADTDSKITVTLSPVKGGARVTLVHSDVPDSHKGYENGGWQDHYFEPMKRYFAKAAPPAAGRRKSKVAARKTKPTTTSKRKAGKRIAAKGPSAKRKAKRSKV
jgi:activator of HSP90 ATPase